MALTWASTHSDALRENAALVSALSECQNQMGTGYLSAFPIELFECVEDKDCLGSILCYSQGKVCPVFSQAIKTLNSSGLL